jgi:ribosomal protein S12 methylthiotransferase accessory factor
MVVLSTAPSVGRKTPFALTHDAPESGESPPIRYRGETHRCQKGFWQGTQRSIPPAETLERIRPHFPSLGITRLANITNLDCIGISVTLAIRPNAATLSQGSGKGFFLEAALASAAMEAIEVFHAEEPELPTFQLPYEHLSGNRIAIEDMLFTKHHLFTPWWPYRWTMGWDLINQEEVAVPWWLVHMGWHPLRERDLNVFQVTSNGLASGNNLLEAINAGLFEVIERDAVACNRVAWASEKESPPVVELKSIRSDKILDLMDRLDRAGVGLVVFDCTVDTEVPVYMAYVYDLRSPSLGVYRGYGAHLDPEIAMIRAISEAAQGRLIYIAGSRDDVFRHSYLRLKQPDDSPLVSAMQALTPSVEFGSHPSEATPSFEGDTHVALRKLQRAGLRQAIVVDLSRPELPVNVVKVVVPGLEGYMFDFYTPGRRAKAFAKRRQVEVSHLPGSVASG